MGRSRGHFDRANCLNPRALFAKLCTVPRKLSPPSLFSPLIERLPPPLFDPPPPLFSHPRIRFLAFLRTTRGWRRGGKQGGWIDDQLWIEMKRQTMKGWTWLHWEWFCSRIYPLLRLSFLKMYLILSGKSWNYFSIQFESVLSFLAIWKREERGGSVIN